MTEFSKINTAVVLEVFGWRWRTCDVGDKWNTLHAPPYDKTKGEKFGYDKTVRDVNQAPNVCEHRDLTWLLVDAMREKGYRLALRELKGGDWRAAFLDQEGNQKGAAIRATDTLAIAIAALDVVRENLKHGCKG